MRPEKIVLLIFLALAGAAAGAQERRPNILLIIADDLGYTDMGAYGSEIPTPTLDALAYAGIRFTNFHTGRACQQTRSMLMSGRGVESVLERRPPRADSERANQLDTGVVTLPELLQSAGYGTYIAGKWDLGLTPEAMPVNRGFDRSFVLLEASSSHFPEYFWSERSWYFEDDRHLELEDLPADFYATRSYTDKMLEYLGDHDGDAPWFAMLTYTSPHWPLQAPDDWLDRHAGRYDKGYDVLRERRVGRATELGVLPRGLTLDGFEPTAKPWDSLEPAIQSRYARANEIYASMVEYLDQQIGRIVEHLERTAQLDDTIVFFMSDHGASAEEIGILDGPTSMMAHFDALVAKRDNSYANIGRIGSFVDRGVGFGEAATAPFRYYKGRVTEGGIRAAAFVHYPAALPEPSIDGEFITVMDMLPTFADVAGIEALAATAVDGVRLQPLVGESFWPYLTGRATAVHAADDTAGWVRGDIGAIIQGRFKLTNQPHPAVPVSDADLTWRLYDLDNDPGETVDLAARHPALVESLRLSWERDWK